MDEQFKLVDTVEGTVLREHLSQRDALRELDADRTQFYAAHGDVPVPYPRVIVGQAAVWRYRPQLRRYVWVERA